MTKHRDTVGSRESSRHLGSSPSRESLASEQSDNSLSSDDAASDDGMFSTRYMRLSKLWRRPQVYKRVRIQEDDDMDAAYPFIYSCIEDATIADKVEELVIGNGDWQYSRWYDHVLTQELKPVWEARQDTHAALLSHVRGLGLSEAMTALAIDSLEWKRNIYMWSEPSSGRDGRHLPLEYDLSYAATLCVVLLSLCRNITTVRIENVISHDILDDYLIQNNFGKLPQQGLQKLTTVIVSPHSSIYALHDAHMYFDTDVTDILFSFHRLPAMRSFSFVGITIENATERQLLPPATGTFKKLSFEHVDLHGTTIGNMLRVSRDLEEFSLSLGGMYQLLGSCISVRPKTLGKCLLEHKTTLRVLDLDIEEATTYVPEEEHDTLHESGIGLNDEGWKDYHFDEWYRLDEADSTGPLLAEHLPNTRPYGLGLGSLHDFEFLTHLSVQLTKLVGEPREQGQGTKKSGPQPRLVDMLPKSLEYLRLYGYKEGDSAWLDEQVEELMAKKAKKLPKLKEIVYDEPEGEGGSSEEGGDGDEEKDDDEDEDEEGTEADYWHRPRPDLRWLRA